MRLIVAILARNEAGPDRYLRRVLAACQKWSDAIVVLDDRSSDETPKVCSEYGCVVKTRHLSIPAWGNESSARQELWELALTQCAGPNDWVLVNDADQILQGDVRGLCLSRELNSWAMPLYDLWSETEYRTDGHWQAHLSPRPWLFAPLRVPLWWKPEWPTRGIHTGHCPVNFPLVCGIAPPDVFWLHYGWSNEAHRKAKYEQYMSQSHQLSPNELAHAQSILA